MYRSSRDETQQVLENFYLPFGGRLNPNNRWVKLAELVPWTEFEDEYAKHFPSELGPPSKSFRMALGAILIKHMKKLTDEQTVEEITENPYLQYLLGMEGYRDRAPFDETMMVHFRKRISADMLSRINGRIVENQLQAEAAQAKQAPKKQTAAADTDQDHPNQEMLPGIESDASGKQSVSPSSAGKRQQASKDTNSDPAEESSADESDEPKHQGKLLLDATCVPADIRYPTDLSLLNEAREKTEHLIDILYEPVKGTQKKPRTYRRRARRDYLEIVRYGRKKRKNPRKAIRKQLQYLRRNLKSIEQLCRTVSLAILSRKQYRDLLVISELYRQQQEMYDQRTHSVSGRIVSISQPHVRPIVRGKDRNNVEFGAKVSVSLVNGYSYLDTVSWDAYHEGNELIQQVESFHRRFGHYPESVHADKIYQNRENRKYCRQNGIRLSGPPLGRPPKDQDVHKEQKRITRSDELARIPIEGAFGTLKRRYGWDLVKEKLSGTSEHAIAAAVLVMNMDRILRILFVLWWRHLRNRLSWEVFAAETA